MHSLFSFLKKVKKDSTKGLSNVEECLTKSTEGLTKSTEGLLNNIEGLSINVEGLSTSIENYFKVTDELLSDIIIMKKFVQLYTYYYKINNIIFKVRIATNIKNSISNKEFYIIEDYKYDEQFLNDVNIDIRNYTQFVNDVCFRLHGGLVEYNNKKILVSEFLDSIAKDYIYVPQSDNIIFHSFSQFSQCENLENYVYVFSRNLVTVYIVSKLPLDISEYPIINGNILYLNP